MLVCLVIMAPTALPTKWKKLGDLYSGSVLKVNKGKLSVNIPPDSGRIFTSPARMIVNYLLESQCQAFLSKEEIKKRKLANKKEVLENFNQAVNYLNAAISCYQEKTYIYKEKEIFSYLISAQNLINKINYNLYLPMRCLTPLLHK